MSPFVAKVVFAWGLGALVVSTPTASRAAPTDSQTRAPKIATKTATRGAGPKGQVAAAAVLAAPAPAAAAAPATATPAPATPRVISVSAARGAIERGLTELGTLMTQARQSGDMVRVACVQDKQDRAAVVVEVASGEILVLQDAAADAQSRALAGEKLAEAADRLSGLVSQARACRGADPDRQGGGENQSTNPQSVIPTDPTSNVPTIPRMPPRIDPRPPVASPVL